MATTARLAAPPSLEADQKHIRQARAKKTTLAENKVMYEDGKGYTGGLPGYITIGEDRQIQEIYRNWVKSNNGAHISGGI